MEGGEGGIEDYGEREEFPGRVRISLIMPPKTKQINSASTVLAQAGGWAEGKGLANAGTSGWACALVMRCACAAGRGGGLVEVG